MDNLLSKVTLYDIISIIIPGLITLLCCCSIVPEMAMSFINTVNNSWFIFAIVIVCSYSIGWTLSETVKIINKLFNQTSEKNNILLVARLTLFFFLLVVVALPVVQNCRLLAKSLFIFVSWSFLCTVQYFYITRGKKQKEEMQLNVLCLECYQYLKELYPQIDKKFNISWDGTSDLDKGDEDKIIKAVKEMSRSCFLLIQTEDRYYRIHNYNSSKSFSKNLSGASLILAITFSYQFYQPNGMTFDIIYGSLVILSIICFFILHERFLSFEKTVNVLTATYFIDYMKNKELKTH